MLISLDDALVRGLLSCSFGFLISRLHLRIRRERSAQDHNFKIGSYEKLVPSKKIAGGECGKPLLMLRLV